MLVESLLRTIATIEQYQKQTPESYDCIEADLNCLKSHMNLVVKYLAPLADEEMCISLPKSYGEIKYIPPHVSKSSTS